MTEPFDSWRSEIVAELEAANSELVGAQAEYEKTLFLVRSANAERASLAAAFARVPRHQLAGALTVKRHGYETSLDRSGIALSRITNQIASLRRRISDLEAAIEQLKVITPPPDDADASNDAAA